MNIQKDNRLAWGITLLLFGIMFMLRQLNIFPQEISEMVFDLKNYPLIIGLVFLFTHKNKTIGLVLITVGLLFRLSDIIRLTHNISDFIWPTLLIIAGAIMVFGKGKGRK
ncbi:MAG: DUF5668 domain-containing protein [Paludibacter sp.]|nr:DUF5668 domain-containing protein [Paludibacter sp.]